MIIALMAVIVIVSTIWYTVYQFQQIELEMAPYMTKRAQVERLYLENQQFFAEAVVELNTDKNSFYYCYDNSNGKVLDMGQEKEIECSATIMYLFETLQINIIEKYKNRISFRQVKPAPENYIYIGMNYNYESNEWTFSYYHLDNYRELDHKWIYRLYDLIYNRGNGKPLIS